MALRRTAEQPLTAAIRKACVRGVSIRSVEDLVKAMGGTGIIKGRVSGRYNLQWLARMLLFTRHTP